LRDLEIPSDPRLLTGVSDNEDAAVLSFPVGQALVQTVDFLTPIVNDPYRFGQIAAANALSDVYAMGGNPVAAMNIVCFPSRSMPLDILRAILSGGLAKIREAGAVMAGGHSVDDPEIKYGLCVSGEVAPDRFSTNHGLLPGDLLILTKPIGTGILATAVKQNAPGPGGVDALKQNMPGGDALKQSAPGNDALEEILWRTASRLNAVPGQLIREFGLKAATDVTGFGLGGHILEMSAASGLAVELESQAIPLIPHALDFAAKGIIPGGSLANRRYFEPRIQASPTTDPNLLTLLFDAQTSGGMLLCVPESLVKTVNERLTAEGDLAAVVGRVLDEPATQGLLHIR